MSKVTGKMLFKVKCIGKSGLYQARLKIVSLKIQSTRLCLSVCGWRWGWGGGGRRKEVGQVKKEHHKDDRNGDNQDVVTDRKTNEEECRKRPLRCFC